jgi:hypothetical protein
MNGNPSAKLFKDPANWPIIPPWWLVSSTDAAALLNIKPATLHSWRARDQGPKPYPPMYLRPTQGRPLYYQYGTLRAWAASKLGMAYQFDDQCMDFFREVFLTLADGTGGVRGRIPVFERQFAEDRKRLLRGENPYAIQPERIHELDVYHSRQPQRTGPNLL